MANYDVSFLNPKLRKASGNADYGFLVDQLDILQSKLEADGKLSPGDYVLLKQKAQEVYAHPGLTPAQRSNIEVKIASYDSKKSQVSVKDAANTTDLNNDVKDSQITANMLLAKDPAKLVESNIKINRAKLNRLTDSIDQAENAGENASSYLIEYQNTLNDYNDLLDVKDKMKAGGTGKPIDGYAAYITTNTKGEITDVKIAKAGDITGYAETNGLYGGLQIYGKARKEGDKQVFKIGNSSFSAANIMIPDPANPGSFKTNQLTSDQQKKGGTFKSSQAGVYQDVDLTTLRSQTSVPTGQYAVGSKGFIYQAKADGTYKKIVNATPDSLGLHDGDYIKLPKSYENDIVTPRVTETNDFSAPVQTPLPTTLGGGPAATSSSAATTPAQQNQQNTSTTTAPTGTSRTPGPTTRTPSDAAGYAAKTQGGVRGFLQSVFGGFKGNQ